MRGTNSSGGTTPSAKIGVVLTYNLPGFWANYLKYEAQYATQLNANLTTPLVANVEANGNEAAQQITDVRSLIAQGVKALIVGLAKLIGNERA
jgi:ABC-type sugar transport system substrate-binding protein